MTHKPTHIVTDKPHELHRPDGTMEAAGLKALQNVTEASVKAQARAEMAGFGGLLNKGLLGTIVDGVAQGLQGVAKDGFAEIAGAANKILSRLGVLEAKQDRFTDGQLSLNGRIDLLDGTRGYAMAYMSKNINGGLQVNNVRRLPFDAQIGPAKGAHVDSRLGGLVLDEAGLWSISMLATARSTAYTSSLFDTDSVRAKLSIYAPDGTLYSERILQYFAGSSAVSLTTTIPVVVAKPGYIVLVEVWSSRWRWWDGGTRYSALAAVKHDSRIEHPGRDVVPDER